MAAPSVTVVIVNWNGGDLLLQCLARLRDQTLAPERVLVMDNGSTDGSAQRVVALGGATVEFLGSNLGFAAANNRAVNRIDTEFVALLNPDALAEPNWLERLVAAASTSPAAAFASRQMMLGSPGILDGAGDAYHSSGLAWRRRYGATLDARDLEPREVFSPCAAAALYRAAVWREVGGMDETYFCYFEDVDLGFRIRLAGHSCVYVPDAVVEHVGSATTGGRRSEFAIYHGHRNLVWTFVKDMPGAAFWLMLPLHLLLNLVSIGWFALRGRGTTVLRAKRDAIAGLPRAWRARKAVQAARRVPIRAIWRTLDRKWLLKWGLSV